MDKNQLEAKITKTAEEIFAFEASSRNKSNAEFISLRTKLADYIWRWAKLVFSENRLKNATAEVMDCVELSLTAFHGNAENYIKYISAAMKQVIRRANESNTVFERRIIELPDQKERRIMQFLRYAVEYGKDIDQTEIQQKLAGMCGCEEKEIAKLVAWYSLSKVQSENILSSDGDEVSLFDTDAALEANRYAKHDDEIVAISEFKQVLCGFDNQFAREQERVKPYLSALLTRQILNEIENAKIDSKQIPELFENCTFTKTERARDILNRFLFDRKMMTQEEVAAMFGRDKTDASRTMRNFLHKLKK